MNSFYTYSEAAQQKSITIDPRFEELIQSLVQTNQLKSKAEAMRFIYDAVAGGDRQKLQSLLSVKQPDLADLVKSLQQVGKVVNLSPEIHQAFVTAGHNPEQVLLVLYDALIKGDSDAMSNVLQELGRNITAPEQKQVVANAFGHFVELKRNWKLKDLINRWIDHDEEQGSQIGGRHGTPNPRTKFELDEEDGRALSELLNRAKIGGKPAIMQAIGHWIKNDPKILQAVIGELPGTQKNLASKANPGNNDPIAPHEVAETEQELVQAIYSVLEKSGELQKLQQQKGMDRRNFMKGMVGAAALGGMAMAGIQAVISKMAGGEDHVAQQRQEVEHTHKYAPYTIDLERGGNATYRYNPQSKVLEIHVTPANTHANNPMLLATHLVRNIQQLGYQAPGRPSISQDGESLVITVPNVVDPGNAQPLNQLVRFAHQARGSVVAREWTKFSEWVKTRS